MRLGALNAANDTASTLADENAADMSGRAHPHPHQGSKDYAHTDERLREGGVSRTRAPFLEAETLKAQHVHKEGLRDLVRIPSRERGRALAPARARTR
jgi:hypothetical protein